MKADEEKHFAIINRLYESKDFHNQKLKNQKLEVLLKKEKNL